MEAAFCGIDNLVKIGGFSDMSLLSNKSPRVSCALRSLDGSNLIISLAEFLAVSGNSFTLGEVYSRILSFEFFLKN